MMNGNRLTRKELLLIERTKKEGVELHSKSEEKPETKKSYHSGLWLAGGFVVLVLVLGLLFKFITALFGQS